MSEFAPSLKAAKDFLAARMQDDWRRVQQDERLKLQLQAREEPPRDPEMVARVNAGFAELVAQLKMANAVHKPACRGEMRR